jgi:DNA-binding IscR family transcriptional regulator
LQNDDIVGMTKQTKILLGLSIASFVISFTGLGGGVFMPLGAVFLGLFMISKVLEGEVALFDEEQRKTSKAAQTRKDAAPFHAPVALQGAKS